MPSFVMSKISASGTNSDNLLARVKPETPPPMIKKSVLLFKEIHSYNQYCRNYLLELKF